MTFVRITFNGTPLIEALFSLIPGSLNTSQRVDILAKELEDLRRCNKRLADDKAVLESQFLATEDTIFTLTKENEELKVQVKNLENVSEMKGEWLYINTLFNSCITVP